MFHIFFNSLNNRLRITNYYLKSVSTSLLKFTRFIKGNNIASTILDMIRNLQHLHINKKSFTYKTLPYLLIVIEFNAISKSNGCKLAKNHWTRTKFKLDL